MDLETIPWFVKFTTSKVNNHARHMQDKANSHQQHATVAYAQKRGQQ